MSETSAADLIGRLPTPRSHEPMIVTTLRRYSRRGAPLSLLSRLAGGTGQWRRLNEWWNIDGTVVGRAMSIASGPPPLVGEPGQAGNQGGTLSTAERRIWICQLADEYAASRHPFPSLFTLADLFGVKPGTISHDLRVLSTQERIAWRLVVSATGLCRQMLQ
jgi:hypothetical protein